MKNFWNFRIFGVCRYYNRISCSIWCFSKVKFDQASSCSFIIYEFSFSGYVYFIPIFLFRCNIETLYRNFLSFRYYLYASMGRYICKRKKEVCLAHLLNISSSIRPRYRVCNDVSFNSIRELETFFLHPSDRSHSLRYCISFDPLKIHWYRKC